MRLSVDPQAGTVAPPRTPARHFLMCPPAYFDVVYAINPWMDPTTPIDRERARRQWEGLRASYLAHGHTVATIAPEPDLPDMVYAANGALVIDGIALVARFHHPQRRAEEAAYARWLEGQGFDVRRASEVQEGEGDFALAGDTILAGTGFRSSRASHLEVAKTFQRPVVTLELIDPRFYHLDTALCVLDDQQIMYNPGAFSSASQRELARRFPDAILADAHDALAFGLNAASDGYHVFLPAEAEGITRRLDQAGFRPVPIELSELVRGGGSVKCCTLELRRPRPGPGGGRGANTTATGAR